MSLTFGPASDADWLQAWLIQRERFRALQISSGSHWGRAQVQKCEAEWEPAKTRVIEIQGEMVGWLRIECHPDHDWLDLVVIDPCHQGQGTGTAVMRRLQADRAQRDGRWGRRGPRSGRARDRPGAGRWAPCRGSLR